MYGNASWNYDDKPAPGRGRGGRSRGGLWGSDRMHSDMMAGPGSSRPMPRSGPVGARGLSGPGPSGGPGLLGHIPRGRPGLLGPAPGQPNAEVAVMKARCKQALEDLGLGTSREALPKLMALLEDADDEELDDGDGVGFHEYGDQGDAGFERGYGNRARGNQRRTMGSYQGEGYQDEYMDDYQSEYTGDYQGGYTEGYQGGNRGGYQGGNRGGYQGGNRGDFQDRNIGTGNKVENEMDEQFEELIAEGEDYFNDPDNPLRRYYQYASKRGSGKHFLNAGTGGGRKRNWNAQPPRTNNSETAQDKTCDTCNKKFDSKKERDIHVSSDEHIKRLEEKLKEKVAEVKGSEDIWDTVAKKCVVCDLPFDDIEEYQVHADGSYHKLKVRQAAGEKVSAMWLIDTPNKPWSKEVKVEKPLPAGHYRCSACEVDCTGLDSYQAHLKGAKHKKKIRHLSMFSDEYKEVATRVSGVTLGYQTMLDEISEPLVGLEYLYEYKGGQLDFQFACELCDSTLNINSLLSHLTGWKHRRKYIKYHKPSEYVNVLLETNESKQGASRKTREVASQLENLFGRQKLRIRRMLRRDEAYRLTAADPNIRVIDCRGYFWEEFDDGRPPAKSLAQLEDEFEKWKSVSGIRLPYELGLNLDQSEREYLQAINQCLQQNPNRQWLSEPVSPYEPLEMPNRVFPLTRDGRRPMGIRRGGGMSPFNEGGREPMGIGRGSGFRQSVPSFFNMPGPSRPFAGDNYHGPDLRYSENRRSVRPFLDHGGPRPQFRPGPDAFYEGPPVKRMRDFY